jgi:hypothetical protein
MDALNGLGATPWRVNKPMLGHLLTAFEMARDASRAGLLATLGIPQHESTIPVEDFDEWVERRAGKGALRSDVPSEEREAFWHSYRARRMKR